MELLKTWGIPSAGLIIWLGLVFSLIPIAMKYLRTKAQKSKMVLDDLLVNVLALPNHLPRKHRAQGIFRCRSSFTQSGQIRHSFISYPSYLRRIHLLRQALY